VSRYWQAERKQGVVEGYHRKAHPHKRTAAWEEARALRKLLRKNTEQQGRDKCGFIAKKVVVGGQVFTSMHDPGVIDRWLWTEAHQKDDDS
jgi:hypothetical protein